MTNPTKWKTILMQTIELDRVPTREEIEMELQIRKGDEIRKVGTSHMSVISYERNKFDRNSPSNHMANMGQDRDVYTYMEGLENNMKFILIAFNITRVEKT